jgi:hypothetical protein
MRFSIRLADRISVWAMRAAGLDTVNYQQLYFDVLEKKTRLPADISCPYFLSETPANVRVTVDSFGPLVAYSQIEVDDEIIGRKIQEKLSHYSEENRGLSVSNREREELDKRINEILKKEGIPRPDASAGQMTLTRRAQEGLMQLCDEVEHAHRWGILFQFTHSVIPKADSHFVASWMVKRYLAEKDPGVFCDLSGVLYNCKGLAVPEIADDLIQLIKNPRYGVSRSMLCEVLRKTKDPRAADVLASALDDDELASSALESLGKLRAVQYLDRIRKCLRHPKPDARREAKRALKKLGFPVEIPPPPIHQVKNQKLIPKELEEWSTNLDIEALNPVLENLSQCIDRGFGKTEVAEVAGVVDAMKHNQTKAFRFPITAQGMDSELWMAVFMDDVDSPDLYVYGKPDVIQKFEATVKLKE